MKAPRAISGATLGGADVILSLLLQNDRKLHNSSSGWRAAPRFPGLLCESHASMWTAIYLKVSPHGRATRFREDTCFSAMSASYFWTQFRISVSALHFL